MPRELDEFGQPIVDQNPPPLAAVDVVPTGSQMSQEFLNQPFDPNWDDAKKELWGAKWETGVNMTPSDAAREAFKIREDQRKRELDAREKAGDPIRQATLEGKQMKLNEAKRVEAEFQIKRNATIKTIEDILADKDYENMLGPFDGTAGAMYDAAFNEKAQAKRMRLDRLMNMDVLDMTKFLRPVSQDELKYLRTLVPKQTQHWEPTKQYLQEKLATFKTAKRALYDPNSGQLLDSGEATEQPEPNVYQQSQQNPATQLRSQLESGDSVNITQPDGSVLTLKKVTNPDGTVSWE